MDWPEDGIGGSDRCEHSMDERARRHPIYLSPEAVTSCTPTVLVNEANFGGALIVRVKSRQAALRLELASLTDAMPQTTEEVDRGPLGEM